MSADRKKCLWVVGDSTLSSFSDNYYYPRYGYGTRLGQYLDEDVEVKNLALSGRSSKSYTTEAEYQELLSGMEKGDWLLIGFGHNDEKTEEGRYTAAAGGYRQEGSFANSLYMNYIRKAESAGCGVILCTPIVRRTATGRWEPQELHVTEDTGVFAGGDYAQAVRDLGKELRIPVADMTAMTKKLYDWMKPENTQYLHAWTSNQPASVDNTHTNIWGAQVNAYLCMKAVKDLGVCGLAEHIAGLDDEEPYLCREKYLVSNPDYHPVEYDRNLPASSLWRPVGIWKATVFGDVGKAPLDENFTLEGNGNGNIHIAVRENTGKISNSTDGIAMYYTAIPAGQNFVLSAKACINGYFLNDQVSFGLMVRDDMYIDCRTADVLGDYVAAAPLLLTRRDKAVSCYARKSGKLVYGGACSREYKPGDTVELRIEGTADGYACTFGNDETVTGGFDFKLTRIDPEYVYAGMFVARNADITFSDIRLETA